MLDKLVKMFEVTHHFHYRLLTLLLQNQVIHNYLSIVTSSIELGVGGGGECWWYGDCSRI